ncbi:MAG: response regulator, partial [Spirochaetaceae bacterium]
MSSEWQKHQVMVVDDERTTVKTVESILSQNGYTVDSFTDPTQALEAFRRGNYDIVLSDYFMPEMNGDELLKEIRTFNKDCPFIFLTIDSNLTQAIDLIQQGADDYIVKPVKPEDLVFRIQRCLESIRRRNKEENWRQLYASKDIRQTEKMIDQLSKAINQAGGYMWLDLLQEQLQETVDGKYQIDTAIGDLVIETAGVQKQILEYISMIADTNRIELKPQTIEIKTLMQEAAAFCRERLEEDLSQYERALAVGMPAIIPQGMVTVDINSLQEVLNELLINAIKFSPEGTRIILSMDEIIQGSHKQLGITIQNTAQASILTDEQGNQAIGIPQNYSETVFDLFFTTQDFSERMPHEEWPSGSGLY